MCKSMSISSLVGYSAAQRLREVGKKNTPPKRKGLRGTLKDMGVNRIAIEYESGGKVRALLSAWMPHETMHEVSTALRSRNYTLEGDLFRVKISAA